jgi:DNA-binding SARP family transcriptional activator/tetratricopeptide (TPR) repeat protein
MVSMDSAAPQRGGPFRLRVLGGLAIANGTGGPLASSPPRRRLAILAMVAASRDRGIAREKLLYYFWPEAEEEKSRHALTQTLYAIRRDLGGAEVFRGSSELRVEPGVLTSDAADFESAAERGDHAGAAELYSGPFLDGVFLSGLPDFERWVEDERSRLARRAAESLEKLASESERRGDWASAERWWRRLATLEPLSAPYAVGLMRALAALGDRAAAIRHGRTYDALVRAELESAPDASVSQLLAQLIEQPAARVMVDVPPPPPPSPAPAPISSVPAAEPASGKASPRRWVAALGAGAAVAVLLLILLPRLLRQPSAPLDNQWLLVTDVENATGDTVFDRSISVALSSGLQQTSRVSLVARSRVRDALALMGRSGADSVLDESLAREVAQRVGVRTLLVPSIARLDSVYVINARIVDAATGDLIAAEQARSRGRGGVLDALDELSARLRRRFGESVLAAARDAVPLPQATTSSLEALKLYADGNQAFNNADYPLAATLYESAIARDSNFALAHAALGTTHAWSNQRPLAEEHFARALSLLDRLSAREQVLIRARVEGWRGNWEQQATLLSGYLMRDPEDIDARSQLGYAYMRAHRLEEARGVYEPMAASGQADAGDLINLAVVYRGLRDAERSVSLYRQAFAINPSYETEVITNGEYGMSLVFAGRTDEARAAFMKMLAGNQSQQSRGQRSRAYLDIQEGRFADATAHLAEAIAAHQAARQQLSEARMRLLRSQLLEARGLESEANVERQEVWRIVSSAYLEPTMLLWIGAGAARHGELARARVLLDSIEARSNADNKADQTARELMGGALAAAAGRTEEANGRFAVALKLDSSTYVRSEVAGWLERLGEREQALRLFTAVDEEEEFGWEGHLPALMATYRMGRLRESLGDSAGAQVAYEKFAARWARGDADIVALAEARGKLEEYASRNNEGARRRSRRAPLLTP